MAFLNKPSIALPTIATSMYVIIVLLAMGVPYFVGDEQACWVALGITLPSSGLLTLFYTSPPFFLHHPEHLQAVLVCLVLNAMLFGFLTRRLGLVIERESEESDLNKNTTSSLSQTSGKTSSSTAGLS